MKYFLYITGCDMNYSDAERIASVFNAHGFTITASEKEADVLVAVACSVREKAVHKILGKVHQWNNESRIMKHGRKIIVTGCILDSDKKKLSKKTDLVFGISDINELEKFLESQYLLISVTSKASREISRAKPDNILNLESNNNYLYLKPQYKSNFSVYVPIMTGCDNFCSYCAVPFTRGREVSRSEKDILKEVKDLVEKGYKEITLLGQNVNSYGLKEENVKLLNCQIASEKKKIPVQNNNLTMQQFNNKNISKFVTLLKKIDQLDGDFWVRFYANHPKDFSDELIDFLKNSKHFCHYIHLPLQSGDNDILKKMNRRYTAEQYLEIIKKIREEIPDCAITTDIIVGFPGESEKQFDNTAKLLEKVGFDMVFISEYSPRSGTVAANMEDDVPHLEKGRRKKFLNDEVLAKSVLANNKKLVGKKVKVLIYKKDSPRPSRAGQEGFLVGKNEGLKDIRISVGARRAVPGIGEFANVKITKATSWGMEGRLIIK